MTAFRVSTGASHRLDEIYDYTRRTWGEAQADAYIRGLFAKFKAIAARAFPWGAVPAEFGVDGHLCRHEIHLRQVRRSQHRQRVLEHRSILMERF